MGREERKREERKQIGKGRRKVNKGEDKRKDKENEEIR